VRRYRSLRRRSDFARVQRRGKRRVGPLFVLLTTDAAGDSRVGITVSKGIGNAVVRNRLRRRVKAILDRSAFGTPPHRDVVLIARPGAGEADFAAVAAELDRLLRP
jgi:ribonuclease P protein component